MAKVYLRNEPDADMTFEVAIRGIATVAAPVEKGAAGVPEGARSVVSADVEVDRLVTALRSAGLQPIIGDPANGRES